MIFIPKNSSNGTQVDTLAPNSVWRASESFGRARVSCVGETLDAHVWWWESMCQELGTLHPNGFTLMVHWKLIQPGGSRIVWRRHNKTHRNPAQRHSTQCNAMQHNGTQRNTATPRTHTQCIMTTAEPNTRAHSTKHHTHTQHSEHKAEHT